MLTESVAFFAREILRGPPLPQEAPYHGRFLLGDHHYAWDKLAQKHKRICIQSSRDHGKSFFWSLAFPLWKACNQPHKRGYIFSASLDQAIRLLTDIKDQLEANSELEWLIPPKRNRELWSRTGIKLTNGHRIYARGYGSKIRGDHPTWIVNDDVLNDEDAYSEIVRRRHIDYFYHAISNMIVPDGQVVVVGTPFSPLDLYGDLSENDAYEFARFPALDPKTGKALWPARYNEEMLAAKRAEIGPIRFVREFLCSPIGDSMSLFPSVLFRGEPVEQAMVKLGMPLDFWKKLGVDIYMGVDFALSSSVSADYTVIWIMGVDAAGNRWIVDIIRGKGLAYEHQKSLIIEHARKYDPGLIFLESNQAQRIFGDELIRGTDLPVVQYHTGAEKHSLERGVPSLRVLLENQKIRIPRGDARSVELTNVWQEEMSQFTFDEGKVRSVGAHADTVMACWLCEQACKRGGAFSFSFGDEDEMYEQTVEELVAEQCGGQLVEVDDHKTSKHRRPAGLREHWEWRLLAEDGDDTPSLPGLDPFRLY